MIRRLSVLICGALACASAALAQPAPPKNADAATTQTAVVSAQSKTSGGAVDYLKRLEEKNRDVKTMVGSFRQSKTSELFMETRESRGKFYYLRPNRFRVDYMDPKGKEEGRALLLENEMWDYVAEIKQVTHINLRAKTGKQRNIDQFLLTFGIQTDKALEFFDVTLGEPAPTPERFTLVFAAKDPDETMQFLRAVVTVEEKTLRPSKIRLEEASGDVTDIALENVEYNSKVSESLFKPDWPSGTETIEQ